MVFVTFSYNTLNATCNMQQSQECPPSLRCLGVRHSTQKLATSLGFSPGKPDLCSDRRGWFGRSKVGGY